MGQVEPEDPLALSKYVCVYSLFASDVLGLYSMHAWPAQLQETLQIKCDSRRWLISHCVAVTQLHVCHSV